MLQHLRKKFRQARYIASAKQSIAKFTGRVQFFLRRRLSCNLGAYRHNRATDLKASPKSATPPACCNIFFTNRIVLNR